MRILFLQHNGKLYGANKSLLSIVLYLSKTNDIFIISPFRNYFADVLDKHNIKHQSIPYYASFLNLRLYNIKYLIYPVLVLLDLIVFPYILYKAYRFSPDIIYSNSSIENLGILIAKILKRKHITHVREFGDLDYDFKFLLGARNKRRYLNLSNGIIFNSKIIEAKVLPQSLQIAKTKLIYNGIKLDTIENSYLELPNCGPIVLGLVGYLYQNKGQLEAISFLKKHITSNKNIKVKIFGDGETNYIRKIKQFISNNQMTAQVEFMGFNNNVDQIYKSIDILLIFAKNEAFGRVTIEAMQKGLPVIAFKGGGTLELIDDRIDGLFFSDESEFDICIHDLLNSPQLYNTISKNAMSKVRSKFSEELCCKNIESFIQEINSF